MRISDFGMRNVTVRQGLGPASPKPHSEIRTPHSERAALQFKRDIAVRLG